MDRHFRHRYTEHGDWIPIVISIEMLVVIPRAMSDRCATLTEQRD